MDGKKVKSGEIREKRTENTEKDEKRLKKSTRRKLSSSDEKVQKTKKGTGAEEVLHYATNNWDK